MESVYSNCSHTYSRYQIGTHMLITVDKFLLTLNGDSA